MKKRYKIIIGIILVIVLAAAGGIIYFIKSAPPGEEWIAYGNDEVIASIDRQLEGMDMDKLMEQKGGLVLEKDIQQLQSAVADGRLTYEELTAICLYRIKTLDQCNHGYNSVVVIAPDAMDQARACDAHRKEALEAGQEGALTSLYGIPVMLKDNINTADMATSSGAEAFSDFIPETDAGLVQNLRQQGAVILGKNNMAEFAYYVSSTMPNGYSGNKGQTVNPFGPLKISPSGSSSGSAVAVTANFVPVSIGTETAGSIMGPAAANSVVGFKPSRESISSEGIMPLIHQIDTPGPLAKTVADAALAYEAMSGVQLDLEFDGASLEGKTIGISYYEYNDQQLIERIRDTLRAAGATVVDVEIPSGGVVVQNNIYLTFKQDFEAYTQQYGFPITRLADLIAYNNEDAGRRARYGQDLLEAANEVAQADPSAIEGSMANARSILDDLFNSQGLDAIVFLNTTESDVAAAAGYPELSVPIGTNSKGEPQGATFMTGAGADKEILEIGYAFEQAAEGRCVPER